MSEKRLSTLISIGAAVLTWAAVTGIVVYLMVRGVNGVELPPLPVVMALAFSYLGAMLVVIVGRGVTTQLALWVQLGSALAMGALLELGFLQIYTIIWIAAAAHLFSFRTSFALLVAVMAVWHLIDTLWWGNSSALISTMLYGTFHLFALLSARAVIEAERARDDVQNLNRELLATQHLLSEASRQAERTRIARDLHDLLGHHLTALSINLQIAERVADGVAAEKVAESRALARLLLSDVREAVTALREQSALDFARAVQLVVDNVPQLDIELDIEDDLRIDDVDIAESLLRCVQECITNTLRHANARSSWIRVWQEGNTLRLQVYDDGRATDTTREGNGLTGMRERLARLGGSLTLDRFRDALRVNVEIPLEE